MDPTKPRQAADTPDELPADARRFVLDHIESVAELEALLLLRQPAPENWTAAQLAARLYVPESTAVRVLTSLFARGFLMKVNECFRLAPAREELRAGLEAVAHAYPRFLIPVTQLIHDRQSSATRRFADAFKLGEKP
jgi:hypothetical protein